MTEETMEQIKRDSKKWFGDDFKRGNRSAIDIFNDGATHQHPIAFSAGKRDGLSKAIEAIRALIVPTGTFSSATTYAANAAYENAIKELEKLKL